MDAVLLMSSSVTAPGQGWTALGYRSRREELSSAPHQTEGLRTIIPLLRAKRAQRIEKIKGCKDVILLLSCISTFGKGRSTNCSIFQGALNFRRKDQIGMAKFCTGLKSSPFACSEVLLSFRKSLKAFSAEKLIYVAFESLPKLICPCFPWHVSVSSVRSFLLEGLLREQEPYHCSPLKYHMLKMRDLRWQAMWH